MSSSPTAPSQPYGLSQEMTPLGYARATSGNWSDADPSSPQEYTQQKQQQQPSALQQQGTLTTCAPSRRLLTTSYVLQYPEGQTFSERVSHFAQCHDVICHMVGFLSEVQQLPLRRVSSQFKAAVDEGGVYERSQKRVDTLVEKYNEAVFVSQEPSLVARLRVSLITIFLFLLFGVFQLLMRMAQDDYEIASNLIVVGLVIVSEVGFVAAVGGFAFFFQVQVSSAVRISVLTCLLTLFGICAVFFGGMFYTTTILRNAKPLVAECAYVDGLPTELPSQVLFLAPRWWNATHEKLSSDYEGNHSGFWLITIQVPFPEWRINCTAAVDDPFTYAANFSLGPPTSPEEDEALWPSPSNPRTVYGVDESPSREVVVTNASILVRSYGVALWSRPPGNWPFTRNEKEDQPLVVQGIRHDTWHKTVSSNQAIGSYRRSQSWVKHRRAAISAVTGRRDADKYLTPFAVFQWFYIATGIVVILSSAICLVLGGYKYRCLQLCTTKERSSVKKPLTREVALDLVGEERDLHHQAALPTTGGDGVMMDDRDESRSTGMSPNQRSQELDVFDPSSSV